MLPLNKRRIFGEKNLISFGTFPYALCNFPFTNKLSVKGQNKKRNLQAFLLKEFTAKSVDEDPVACQRWIFRKEI